MTAPHPADRLSTGVGYAWRGFGLIRQPRIRRFVIIPLLVNIVLFSAGIICLVLGLDAMLDRILPNWLAWLRYLLWPLFTLASLVVVFYVFTIVANLIASPFNALLAAAVERHLTGQTADAPFSWRASGREVVRTVGAELRKLAYFLLWALPCLALFILPGINLIAAPAWFLFGAWMMAVEYVDCPLGNHGQPFPAVKQQLRQRRKLALGFGSAVMAMTMIPILNFIAMPVGVAGATALYVDEFAGQPARSS